MNKLRRNRTANIARIGMFAAVTAILSQMMIPLPSGVPISLQTFAAALTGYVLGPGNGLITIFVYIMLGAVGIPVFTAFGAGPGVLFGNTGGFIWGFLCLSTFCGLAVGKKYKFTVVLFSMTGLLLCHLAGVIQFSAVTGIGIREAVLSVSLPYLPKDGASLFLAFVLGKRLRKQLHYL